jgi:hypothetical protein
VSLGLILKQVLILRTSLSLSSSDTPLFSLQYAPNKQNKKTKMNQPPKSTKAKERKGKG